MTAESILVLGSVALDSVKTPFGQSTLVPGGSAVYFSLAGRCFAPVQMLGAVGTDFPSSFLEKLSEKAIDLSGLQTLPGKTFQWVGEFTRDLKDAKTISTHLNVVEEFRPRLHESHKKAGGVFLANCNPHVQWEVLSQIERPRWIACDTMSFWIEREKAALIELLNHVHIFFINEEEAKMLAGESNLMKASKILSSWGPSLVVIKKGENGVLLRSKDAVLVLPSYPTEQVVDPTGAGDSFAGGFLGYLHSRNGDLKDWEHLKRAAAYGSVIASCTIESFGTERLEEISMETVQERLDRYARLLRIDPAVLVS